MRLVVCEKEERLEQIPEGEEVPIRTSETGKGIAQKRKQHVQRPTG